ncbi:hypothetical protein [Embleya sp. NPDC059237]|uniref:hypothetical protein n=1 Tax=Embleya sp. NPDC059237 TaxID=3346784 RepID=UPI0036C4AF53
MARPSQPSSPLPRERGRAARPLTDAEAVTVVPGLHPIWADTTAREVTGLNRDVGGTLRGWHRVTAHRLAASAAGP